MALFAVPTALWQVLVLRDRHNARLLQIAAHLTLAGGVFLITDWLFSRDQRFLSTWPALLAVLPFIALAMRGAVPQGLVSSRRRIVAPRLLPDLCAKTRSSGIETMARSALWPCGCIPTTSAQPNGTPWSRRSRRSGRGIPIRIGEHWYRFERIGLQNPRPDPARRPDRISWLQSDIPAEDLDAQIPYREHAQTHDTTTKYRRDILDRKKSPIRELREGDLHIYVVVRRDSPADTNRAREDQAVHSSGARRSAGKLAPVKPAPPRPGSAYWFARRASGHASRRRGGRWRGGSSDSRD